MGYLAFGILLLIMGGTLAMAGTSLSLTSGWASIALGSILVVAHVAVGPRSDATME